MAQIRFHRGVFAFTPADSGVLDLKETNCSLIVMTTTSGPVVPGQGIQFTVTATNLTSASQYVALSYSVPKFTTSGGSVAWDRLILRYGLCSGGRHSGGQPGL
jgi:hypothetical protein